MENAQNLSFPFGYRSTPALVSHHLNKLTTLECFSQADAWEK